jgi:hypothetical protein
MPRLHCVFRNQLIIKRWKEKNPKTPVYSAVDIYGCVRELSSLLFELLRLFALPSFWGLARALAKWCQIVSFQVYGTDESMMLSNRLRSGRSGRTFAKLSAYIPYLRSSPFCIPEPEYS